MKTVFQKAANNYKAFGLKSSIGTTSFGNKSNTSSGQLHQPRNQPEKIAKSLLEK